LSALKWAVVFISAIMLLSVSFVPQTRAETVTLPYPLQDVTSFFDGTNVYMVGGFTLGMVLDSILSYNPSTGKIVQESAVLKSVVRSATSFWDGKSAYIFGGLAYNDSDPLDDLIVFTPPGNVQTFRHFLPYGMKGNSIAWTGKYAYLFGNCITKSSCGKKNIVMFEPKTMNIAVLNISLPLDVAGTSTVWTGKDIYLFGGMTTSGPTDMIIKFNPATGNITVMKSKLPFARYHTGAVLYGGKAIIFGGQIKNQSYVDQVVIYNTTSGKVTVSEMKLPYPLATRSYVLIKNEVFLCGGSTKSGPMTSIEIFSAQEAISTAATSQTQKIDWQSVFTVSAAVGILAVLTVVELVLAFQRRQRTGRKT